MTIHAAFVTAALALAAFGQSGQQGDRTGSKTVFGNPQRHFEECYINARDGGDDYALLEPCDSPWKMNGSLPDRPLLFT